MVLKFVFRDSRGMLQSLVLYWLCEIEDALLIGMETAHCELAVLAWLMGMVAGAQGVQ